ncbi:hypothetical protein ACHAXR_012058 [Thalassiosira sp. AJA248-18]
MGQKHSVPDGSDGSSSTINQSSDNEQTATPQKLTALHPPQQQSNSTTNDSKRMAAMIEKRSNPPEEDAASHNYGQPLRPPSSSAKNKKSGGASKLVTDCRTQQRASLACIEENYQNKNQACAAYFEAYKKCRKEEHERKLEANARASAW